MLYCQGLILLFDKGRRVDLRKTRRTTLLQVPATPEPEAKPPLDKEQIIEAALALLDKIGLDGLTMRNLAEALGIKAGSLYWHVRNKEELLDLLADAVCAGMQEPDRNLPWRKRLEALAHEYRRALLAHRDAAQILAGTVPSGGNRLRLMENLFSILLAAGFMYQDAAYAGFLMNDYVTEFVLEESRFTATAQATTEEARQAYANFERFFNNLPAELYPSITKLSQYLTTNLDMDERFSFGIQVVLDGLEKRLS
jgi:AcrR family transcriptional regulator